MKSNAKILYRKYDIYTPFSVLVSRFGCNMCKVYNSLGVGYYRPLRYSKKRIVLSECVNEYLALRELSKKCIKFKKMVAKQNNKYIHRYRTRGINMKFKMRSLPVEDFCDMSSSK